MHLPRRFDLSAQTRRLRFAGGLLGLVIVCAGCCGFDRAWRRAAEESPVPPNDLRGRWAGSWRSDVTGHSNELRCLMTPQTNGLSSARFHARYKKGIFRFSFGYTIPLQVRRTGEAFEFEGQADLGWLAGGVYRCEGSATSTNFHSTYESKYDHGVFEMTRPASEGK
jgi:hypothetical protein